MVAPRSRLPCPDAQRFSCRGRQAGHGRFLQAKGQRPAMRPLRLGAPQQICSGPVLPAYLASRNPCSPHVLAPTDQASTAGPQALRSGPPPSEGRDARCVPPAGLPPARPLWASAESGGGRPGTATPAQRGRSWAAHSSRAGLSRRVASRPRAARGIQALKPPACLGCPWPGLLPPAPDCSTGSGQGLGPPPPCRRRARLERSLPARRCCPVWSPPPLSVSCLSMPSAAHAPPPCRPLSIPFKHTRTPAAMWQPPRRLPGPLAPCSRTPSPQPSPAFAALMTVLGLSEQPCPTAAAPPAAAAPRSTAPHRPRWCAHSDSGVHKRRALLQQRHRRLLRCATAGAAAGEPEGAATPLRAAEAARHRSAFHCVRRHEHSDESQSVQTPRAALMADSSDT